MGKPDRLIRSQWSLASNTTPLSGTPSGVTRALKPIGSHWSEKIRESACRSIESDSHKPEMKRARPQLRKKYFMLEELTTTYPYKYNTPLSAWKRWKVNPLTQKRCPAQDQHLKVNQSYSWWWGSKIKIQDIVDEIVKERTKATYKFVYCTPALLLILEYCGELIQVEEECRHVVGKPEMPLMRWDERQRQRFGWIY